MSDNEALAARYAEQERIAEPDELRALWHLQTLCTLRRGRIVSQSEYYACAEVAISTFDPAKRDRLTDLVHAWEGENK